MAHYFVDFKTPPPFGRSMPGAVGYYSKAGLEILYGIKPPPFTSRVVHSLLQPWQPSAEVIEPKVLCKAYPAYVPLNPARKEPSPETFSLKARRLGARLFMRKKCRHGNCSICLQFRVMTSHHLAPKQVANLPHIHGGNQATVEICRGCHIEIHKAFENVALLNTYWPDVVERIRNVLESKRQKEDADKRRAQERATAASARTSSRNIFKWPAIEHAWPK